MNEVQPTFTFTSDQEKGLLNLKEFYNNKMKKKATLSGSAGTGKTTIVKYFLESNNLKYFTCVTAPTHKAKKVIAKATNCEAFTIQKILGLKPNIEIDDFDINNIQFDPYGESQIQFYKLVIIDESSMLNSDLFDYLCKQAAEYNTKLLFLGDPLQLPPVGEAMSKVFTHVEDVFHLHEVVRQKDGNPLMEVFRILRDDIENSTSEYVQYLKNNPINVNDKGEGYEVISDKSQVLPLALQYFLSEEANNPDYVKYTAWTNDNIRQFNKIIHNAKYGEKSPILNIGELILGYNNVITNQSKESLVENSQEYIIEEITESISDYAISVDLVKLRNVDTGGTKKVPVIPERAMAMYLDLHKVKLQKAKSQRGKAWHEYFSFCNCHVCFGDIVEGTNFLRKKDLDYGYGLTTHKTQGSTYENIFVNGNNLNKNINSEDKKKLWYVALSRCSKKAYIILTE
jgi:hypothetical protein